MTIWYTHIISAHGGRRYVIGFEASPSYEKCCLNKPTKKKKENKRKKELNSVKEKLYKFTYSWNAKKPADLLCGSLYSVSPRPEATCLKSRALSQVWWDALCGYAACNQIQQHAEQIVNHHQLYGISGIQRLFSICQSIIVTVYKLE